MYLRNEEIGRTRLDSFHHFKTDHCHFLDVLIRESVHYLAAASKKASGKTVSSGPAPFLDPLSMMAAEEEAADEVDQEDAGVQFNRHFGRP